MTSYHVTLTEAERTELQALTHKGSHRSQLVWNGLILLNCDQGEHQPARSTNAQISKILGVSTRKIDRVKKRFVEEGLQVALRGRKGSRGYRRKVDGEVEAQLIALSCSEPPEGFTRWSLRMLADRVVELGYIESISHETVRQVLKKTNLTRGSERDG